MTKAPDAADQGALRVPFVDLRAQNAALRPRLLDAMAGVLDSAAFILGPDVAAFEAELASMLAVRHAVGVSSGTDALLAVLMALGVGRGHDVVTSPFSFFAAAGAIARVGARPVFADIEPESFNLDPAAAAGECGPRARAIITVHLFGRPAALPKTRVPVIEDAAQAIGAAQLAGAAGCLSFFPTKNLGGFGDGGAVTTNDDILAEQIRLLRSHGSWPKYVHHAVGGNFRIDTLQAAALRVKLPILRLWTHARRSNADRYRALFAATPGIPAELHLPPDVPGHTYNQFVIRAPRRDDLRVHLTNAGIGTEVYYPLPLHLQPCFADLGYRKGALPKAEAAAAEVLALPITPELSAEQQEYVVAQIAAFYGRP